MYSTNSPSTERGTSRTVICAAVHGQTASKIDIVSAADAPFPPSRAFTYVKGAQTDTLRDVRALNASMITQKVRGENSETRTYVG